MAERYGLSGLNEKGRDGQAMRAAEGLDAEAGQELVATRHRGYPPSADDSEKICAARPPDAGGLPRILDSHGCDAVVHYSGDQNVSRPLPLPMGVQFIRENDEIPILSRLALSMDHQTAAICAATKPNHANTSGSPRTDAVLAPNKLLNAPLHTLGLTASQVGLPEQLRYVTAADYATDEGPGKAANEIAAVTPGACLHHITAGNETKLGCSCNNTGSASQWNDGATRTTTNGAQHIFIASGTERIEGKRRPAMAMKQCLRPGTPDPPTDLFLTSMHKHGMLHETLVAWFAGCSLHWLHFPQVIIRKWGRKLLTKTSCRIPYDLSALILPVSMPEHRLLWQSIWTWCVPLRLRIR